MHQDDSVFLYSINELILCRVANVKGNELPWDTPRYSPELNIGFRGRAGADPGKMVTFFR